MAELYRSDSALTLEVLNDILSDGDLAVLRQMAQAFGGVQAHLSPAQLYCTLSPKGSPALNNLTAVLKAMGLRLAVQPLVTSAHAT